MSKANQTQVGGSHYSKGVNYQVWDFVHETGLGFLAGTAVKYIVRHQDKNKLEDVDKALHYIQKLMELEKRKPLARFWWIWNRKKLARLTEAYLLTLAQEGAIACLLLNDLHHARFWTKLLRLHYVQEDVPTVRGEF